MRHDRLKIKNEHGAAAGRREDVREAERFRVCVAALSFLGRQIRVAGIVLAAVIALLVTAMERPMPNPAIFSSNERRVIEKVIRFKDLPYKPLRTKLYSVKELMTGYPRKTLDQRIADHYKAHNKNMPDVHEALAQRIHDHGAFTFSTL